MIFFQKQTMQQKIKKQEILFTSLMILISIQLFDDVVINLKNNGASAR